MSSNSHYEKFGLLLAKYRQEAGIANQDEFAKLVGSAKSTVDNWEYGNTRPRRKKIAVIAEKLHIDHNDLLIAAGYSVSKAVATFDQPFPIDALPPDNFERFCLYFLEKKYPKAKVHRAGGSGHTQEGLDVEVTFPDKTYFTFQCKREKDFGPSKIKEAVAAHTKKAARKHILLTCVANPQGRDEIRLNAEWELWDKEDISLRIRQLCMEDQRKLVDEFFKGQRLALLGETEPGPWQTADEFFAPFMIREGAFSHVWNLVGKDKEVKALVDDLSKPIKQAIFLVGAGGSGKSRVLKEAIESYSSKYKNVIVRFLSPTEEVTNKYLEDLGDSEKLLIVDDAHDRTDLQLLFQYAAVSSHKTKVLLSLRPYGLSYLKSQASRFVLVGERVSEIKLRPLTIAQSTELATQVLKEFDGFEGIAKDIARITQDCPLATVIGAQIAAKEKTSLELIKNEEIFRSTLLGKFQDVIAGNIGHKNDSQPIRQLLKVISLLQPFHPEDPTVAEIITSVEQLDAPEVNRLIRLLTDAGVLFRRGGKYRLSPDLLADHVIESTCIGQSGKSTGYAEKVFAVANDKHVEQILLNLGKLDWRLANGDLYNSQLLDGIWCNLKPSSEYQDAHISAVTAVAYYQPERALEFATNLIHEKKYLRDLPNLIKYAAYNLEYLADACECLWELGKNNNRALNQHPGHSIQILSELCAVEVNKPLEFNETVVDFAMSLFEREDSWKHDYTPFNVLKGILQGEGYNTTSNGRSFTFQRFSVNHDFVAGLRKKVIDASIKILSHTDIKTGILAADFLRESIQYSISGAEREAWTVEFVETLNKIEHYVSSNALDSLVLIAVAQSVSWHANYAEGKTTSVAKRIITALPSSLEFRTTLALIDGYGGILERRNLEESENDWQKYLALLTTELLSTYPDGEDLRSFLENIISHIEDNSPTKDASPHVLYDRLIYAMPALAKATIQNALKFPFSKTVPFAGVAFSSLMLEEHSYAQKMAQQFLDTTSRDLHVAVANGYSGINYETITLDEKDIDLLKTILGASDDWIARNAIRAIRNLSKNEQAKAIDLLKYVKISLSSKLADDVLVLFSGHNAVSYHHLSDEDIDYFLQELLKISELDGYWIETFLSMVSEHHAPLAATFFMTRVEIAADTENWRFRPCNYGPYEHVPLNFRKSNKFISILRQVSQWMKSRRDDSSIFRNNSAKLFNVMFSPFDDALIDFLREWVGVANREDIEIISKILKETTSNFVFEHNSFVSLFLEKAKSVGGDSLENAREALYMATLSGLRSGTPGEPFSKDISIKERSAEIIKGMSKFTPEYRLYEMLEKSADQRINRSIQEAEFFEEL